MIIVFLPSLQWISHILIQSNIINLRIGSHLLFEHLNFLLRNQLGNFTAWVFQIPKYHCIRRTNLHTGGLQPCIHPVSAEVTLLDHSCDWIYISHVIRIGCPTIITTDTTVRVDHDNPILPLISRLDRTDRIADGAFTMVAHPREQEGGHPWVSRL